MDGVAVASAEAEAVAGAEGLAVVVAALAVAEVLAEADPAEVGEQCPICFSLSVRSAKNDLAKHSDKLKHIGQQC